MTTSPELIFKVNDIDDFDSELKGYRNDAFVKMPNGDLFEVFFYDLVRLGQDMGNGIFLSKPGLIILSNVNKSTMEIAIIELWKRGYFEYFKPLKSISLNHFEETI